MANARGGSAPERPSSTSAEERCSVPARRPEFPHASFRASDVWSGARRLESASYLTGGYAIRLGIERAGVPVVALDELAIVWQPNRLKGIGVAPEHGVPFLTATQVFDIRPVARKWLAPSRVDDLAARRAEAGWILVTRSGNVGDAIVSYSPHAGGIISDDLLRVQVKESGHLGYVYAFLRSRHGRAILRSSQYGSIIKHLEPEHLHEVPVPTPSSDLSRELEELVSEAFRLRDSAYRMVLEAEQLFAEGLGARPEPLSDDTPYDVPAVELFSGRRRLDGYHYNPAAEAALHALQGAGRPIARLEDLTTEVFGVPRFKHVYSARGIPYVDSEDIFKINPELTKFIPSDAKRDASRYQVRRGWLLMASSGQLYGVNGSVVLADSWHEGKILSNHIIRLVADAEAVRPGYLQMTLGHPVFGRPLVQRVAFGTEVPEIAPNDLQAFPVVRMPEEMEAAIADRVEQASALRMKADYNEDAAVRRMEQELDEILASGGMEGLEVDAIAPGRGDRSTAEG